MEMDLAVNRYIEKYMDICILAFEFDYVPTQFRNILNVSKNDPQLIEKIEATLLNKDVEELEDTTTAESVVEVVEDTSAQIKETIEVDTPVPSTEIIAPFWNS